MHKDTVSYSFMLQVMDNAVVEIDSQIKKEGITSEEWEIAISSNPSHLEKMTAIEECSLFNYSEEDFNKFILAWRQLNIEVLRYIKQSREKKNIMVDDADTPRCLN